MSSYTLGVDLALSRDFSAAVLVEHCEQYVRLVKRPYVTAYGSTRFTETAQTRPYYRVRGIRRYERGTPVHAVVGDLGRLVDRQELRETTHIVFDRTGMGGVAEEVFERAHREGRLGRHWPYGIAITSGREPGEGTVPKASLVAAVAIALSEDRLELPGDHPLTPKLTQELGDFSAKWTAAGNPVFEAKTEAAHDDLVMALALGVHVRGRGRPDYLPPEEEPVPAGL